jgi:hypothetical protein
VRSCICVALADTKSPTAFVASPLQWPTLALRSESPTSGAARRSNSREAGSAALGIWSSTAFSRVSAYSPFVSTVYERRT